jgi:hypothetical protein
MFAFVSAVAVASSFVRPLPMNEQISELVIGLLGADVIPDREYERALRYLLETGAPPFAIRTQSRAIEFRAGSLFVVRGAARLFPRCVDCAAVDPVPKFRSAIGRRLCVRCFRKYARSHVPLIEA